MADPGSLVYQGREGTGEATIFQSSINPIGAIMQERQHRRKNAIDQQKLDLAQQDKRQKQIGEMINNNFGKPGWFQQEDSVSEIEDLKNKSTEYAYQNPYTDIGALSVKFSKDREGVNRRIAKRNELQKQVETNTKSSNENELIDGDWLHSYQTKILSEKKNDGSYGNRDIDQIDSNKLQLATSHPRSYKAGDAIVDIASDIKNQVINSNDGKVRATDFGLEFDENLKKYRFKVDKNGNISDDVVNYVLEQDSAIGDRIRWDIAKKEIAGDKNEKYLTMDEIDAIDKRFEQIQYRNDPSIVLAERDRVRDVLNQLQQTEIRHNLQIRTPSGSGDGNGETPADVRLERIRNVRSVFANGVTPNQNGVDAIRGLEGGTMGTYKIMTAKPVWHSPNKKNDATYNVKQYVDDIERTFKDNPELKDKLIKSAPDKFGAKPMVQLTVRTSTSEGEPQTQDLFIDLSKDESEEVLNSIYETIGGNKKISNEELYIRKKQNASKKGPSYLYLDEEDPLEMDNGNE